MFVTSFVFSILKSLASYRSVVIMSYWSPAGSTHSSRPRLHRAGIAGMMASDMLCTFAICVKIYHLVSLCSSGIPGGFPKFNLYASAVILCTTCATSSFAKLFLCVLYFNLMLTPSRTKRRVVCAILVFGIAVQFAFLYASAILMVATGSPLGWAMLASNIGSISSTVTDSMIAAALLYTFIRMDATAFRRSTHSLLRRLIVLFFSSGVIVASTTLLSSLLLLNGRSAYVVFFYSLGRVYALTILGNFAVGVPAQHTPTTTPKLNTITGKSTTVLDVNHTPADDQAVIASHLPTNPNRNVIQYNNFAVHLTSAAQPNVGPNSPDCNRTVGTPKV
ncbi:hypothetical protein K438DRAFT_1764117 [Mycena galopus ATCC 62051]|nr:hypothetical protein K438DRAFT_1764117 [Mycena galopus ATCC 62051]